MQSGRNTEEKRNMLDIKDLDVKIGDRVVLHDINLHIGEGETHVLLGPNGSGKTTLLRAIMGFSGLNISKGKILFRGVDVTRLAIHERAKMGMGMLFQRPPTIAGLKLGKLLSVTAEKNANDVDEYAEYLNMSPFLDRAINLGFSGGEIKRSEVLQLMVQDPDFVMLDEPESGVDLENITLIGNAIARLLEKDVHIVNRKKSGLVITHTGFILDYLDADFGHVMCDGEFRCHGNPREILKVIKTSGYKECLVCHKI